MQCICRLQYVVASANTVYCMHSIHNLRRYKRDELNHASRLRKLDLATDCSVQFESAGCWLVMSSFSLSPSLFELLSYRPNFERVPVKAPKQGQFWRNPLATPGT